MNLLQNSDKIWKTYICSMNSTRKSSNLKKKTKLSNLLNKNNLLLFLILLPFSLFSLDVKKNSDSPGSEITPSRVETNKAPLEIDEVDYLGDLIMCAPVVLREAQEQGKTLSQHWAHLLIHGLLHLQGYDHITDTEAEEMEGLEIQLLAKLGFPNPYQ